MYASFFWGEIFYKNWFFFSLIKQTHHAKGRSSVSEFKSAQYFVSGLYAWYKIKQQSCKSSQQQIKH